MSLNVLAVDPVPRLSKQRLLYLMDSVPSQHHNGQWLGSAVCRAQHSCYQVAAGHFQVLVLWEAHKKP